MDEAFQSELQGKWFAEIMPDLIKAENSLVDAWRHSFFTPEEWQEAVAPFEGDVKPWVANCILSAALAEVIISVPPASYGRHSHTARSSLIYSSAARRSKR